METTSAEISPKSPPKPLELEPGLKVTSTLDRLKGFLAREKMYSSKAIEMIERYKQACTRISKLYTDGGKFGGREFGKCDLFDHDFHHVEGDIEIVAKMLPGFLAKNRGVEYKLEDVEDLLYATLLHDVGWLREKSDTRYKWGGEKFFVHCQDSASYAPAILEELSDVFKGDEKVARKAKIAEMLKISEFNPLEGDSPLGLDEKEGKLAGLLKAADFLSYACDENEIPTRVQGLYKEAQAIGRKDEGRTEAYFNSKKSVIARKLGISEEVAQMRFDQGRLTIGDLKFPGESVLEFVASDFLASQKDTYEEWLQHLDNWWGDRIINQDRINYDQNIARIEAIQRLANNYKGEKPAKFEGPFTNPLVYFESLFTGKDIREVRIRMGDKETDSEYWDEVDRRILGVGGKESLGLYERLATPEIWGLLQSAKKKGGREKGQEKTIEALSYLIETYTRKHLLVREKGRARKDRVGLAIAPRAYESDSQGGNLMAAEDIIETFRRTNERMEKDPDADNLPEVEMVWTVRRDKDVENPLDLNEWKSYARRIIGLKGQDLGKVVFGGNEREWRDEYSEFIKTLASGGMEVMVNVGQIMGDGGNFLQVAQENIRRVVNLALENPNVKLVGLQVGLTSDFLDAEGGEMMNKLRKLGKKSQLIIIPSSDMEIKDELVWQVQDLVDHPVVDLIRRGVNVVVADSHGLFPSSKEMEAIALAKALIEKEIESGGQEKWKDYREADDYLEKAGPLLQRVT